MRRAMYLLLMGVLLLSLGSTNAFGQATASATIQGTITDKSGAVVIGAEIVAKNKGTDIARTAISDATGSYRFELLPVGPRAAQLVDSDLEERGGIRVSLGLHVLG